VNDISRGPVGADRSIPELLSELAADVRTLVRDELELARIEMTQKGKQAGFSVGMFGAATLLGLAAFGALTVAVIAALALVLPVWAASFLVAALYAAIAAIAAARGKEKLVEVGSPLPTKTVDNVRRDLDAVREGVERGR
jgi:uncharacterized membrane protein YqjE